jgi:hypothetical protein
MTKPEMQDGSVIKMGVAILCALVLTPLWLLAAYLDWGLVNIDFSLAAQSFSKWPWAKGAVMLTAFTFLFPFFATWLNGNNECVLEGEMAAYALGLLWFPLLAIYPGTRTLGVLSDDRLIWAAFPICLIHFFCARQITREILKFNAAA